MELRFYQNHAVDKALKSLKQGFNPLIVAPTGAGKSLIIAELTKQLADKQIMVITPRIKLLQQNAKLIPNSGILSGKLGSDTGADHQVICGTYQTLIKRDFVTPDIIIVDEAHLVPDDDSEYSALLDRYPDAQIIGLTATPFRGRQKIYQGSKTRWKKAYEIGLIELIEKGFLVPPRAFKTHITVDKEHSTNDDITRDILPVAIEKLESLGKQKTIVFCKDIKHAEFTANELTNLGVKSFCIHSEMTTQEHERIYQEFELYKGHAWLTNCNMLTTGVDLPYVDSIVLIRKIKMGSLYIQIVGRGLRIYPGKSNCAVLDYGKNNSRFGCLDAPKFLKPVKIKGEKGKKHTAEKACEQCDLIVPIITKVCDNCGYEFPHKTTLEIFSSNAQMLSLDVRQGRIVDLEITKKDDHSYLFKYLLDNGDNAIRFVNKQNHHAEKENKTGIALYRVSKGVSKVISIH